jgi:hypothetical protein
MGMTRDISFIKLIADSARGPWSQAAVQDEGRPLSSNILSDELGALGVAPS